MKEEDDGIILSEKHGVNPSIEICTICQKDMGIIMFGKLKDDAEAPKQICLGHLCDDCIARLREEKKRIFMEISDYGFTGRYYIFPDYSITPSVLKDLETILLFI